MCKHNPKLPAKIGIGTASKQASKKGMSCLQSTATMKIVVMRKLQPRTMIMMYRQVTKKTVVLLRTVKCQPNPNVRAETVLKNREGDSRSDKRCSERDSSTNASSCRSSSSCSSSTSSRKACMLHC